MRWPRALCLGLALLAGPGGCRHHNRCDQVESELRAREDDVRHLKDELDRSEFFNQALSRELAAVRGLPGPHGVPEKPSEPYPVRSLRLGRQTGGRASDHCFGDDALQVQVEPLDCENQAIKAPGSLYVEVLEVTKEGLKRPLSSWEVPPPELRRKWQNGLFTTGYLLTFPWKVAPSTEKLRVLARFQMVDGRLFEADKDVTVHLLPEPLRRQVLPAPTPTAPAPAPAPGPKAPAPTLPSPYEVIPKAPTPVPPGMPVSEGPLLTRGRPAKPAAELLRPVPMPPEP